MARDSRGRYLPAAVELSLIDRLTAPLRRISNNWEVFSKAGRRAARMFQIGANLKQGADAVEDFSRKAVSFVEKPVKKFMDFQEQMSSVKAATFDLTKAMDPAEVAAMDAAVAKLSGEARRLGATMKFSATEAAAGMDILSKNFSGGDLQKAQDVIDAMPGVLNTAAATRESIEAAADIQTAAMNQFGLGAKDMGLIGDVFVKTANGSATGLLDLGEALKYSGVTAKAAGLDIETTLGLIGALGNAGKKGSQAGTGLSSVLGNIQAGMKKQKSALAALGINIKDKNGNLRPIVELLAEIDKAADKKFGGKGKGGVRRDRWMQALVGMGSDKEVLAILTKQAGSGELQKLIEANYGAKGAAESVAKAMSDNAAGAAGNLASSYEELELTIGEQLVPKLTELLKWVNEVVNDMAAWSREHPDLVKNIGLVVGGLGAIGLVVGPVIKGIAALTTVWGVLTWGIGAAQQAWVLFKLALAIGLGPHMAVITGIATAALLIYEYWEPLSSFFSGLWASVGEGFTAAFKWIVDKITWARDQVGEIKAALTGDTYVSESKALEQRNAIAGMSETDLRKLQGLGIFSDVANDTIKGQRQAAAVAGKIAGSIGPVDKLLPSLPSFGAANSPPEPSAPPRQVVGAEAPGRFQGELKVTIDAEGQVKKTEIKQSGTPGFQVRANRGRQ